MATTLLSVDPLRPQPELIARAATVLRQGGLVAFPTETVYGLGANALDADAVRRIFTAKGRPATNPLIVHIADLEKVHELAVWSAAAARLAARFWPGPLTLVLPRRAVVPDVVTAGGATVAVRMPAHPVALALIRAAELPLAAPSANRSNEVSPTRAAHVMHSLDGRIDVILDGGAASGGIESTVLDVSESPPRLLRPGLVTRADLEAVLGPLATTASAGAAVARSPGMMARHYAPRTPLELTQDSGQRRVEELMAAGQRVGWLTFAGQGAGQEVIHLPSDPKGYAAALYAALHQLDEKGLDRIIAALPPDDDDWLAVRDRLQRAASAG